MEKVDVRVLLAKEIKDDNAKVVKAEDIRVKRA